VAIDRKGYEAHYTAFMLSMSIIQVYLLGKVEELDEENLNKYLKRSVDFHDGVKEYLELEEGKDFPLLRRIIKGDTSKNTLQKAFDEEQLPFAKEIHLDIEIWLGILAKDQCVENLREVCPKEEDKEAA
jgi:hemerythrin-like domain-containing protein